MNDVYTYYDPDLEPEPVGQIIRLWELSWRANGWKPRLLLPRTAKRHPLFEEGLNYWGQFKLALEMIKASDEAACVSFRAFNNKFNAGSYRKFASMTDFPNVRGKIVVFGRKDTLEDMLTLGPYAL